MKDYAIIRKEIPSGPTVPRRRCAGCSAWEGQAHRRRCRHYRAQRLITLRRKRVEFVKRMTRVGLVNHPVRISQTQRVVRDALFIHGMMEDGWRPTAKKVWRRERRKAR